MYSLSKKRFERTFFYLKNKKKNKKPFRALTPPVGLEPTTS